MNFLFFLPHAKNWNEILTNSVLLKNITNHDNNIFVIGCDKDLDDHCMVHSYYSQKEKKEKICNRCINNKKILKKNILGNYFDIKNFLDQQDKKKINFILKKRINKKNYKNFSINNIPIGKIALHDIILINRLSNSKAVINEHWEAYKKLLKVCLKIYFAANSFYKKNKIDIFISPNNKYSANRVFFEVSKKFNIQHYSYWGDDLIPSNLLTSYKLTKGIVPGPYYYVFKNFEKLNFNINNTNFNEVIYQYFENLILPRHKLNYSAGVKGNTSSEVYDIKSYKRTILVCLSSEDEDLCLTESNIDIRSNLRFKKIFKSQIDWLENIFLYAKKNENILFIIRPHPRDWSLDVKGMRSESYYKFEKFFKENQNKNFIIDFPRNKVSLYSYLDSCDLLLTYGSSVNLTFGLLGIPVVDGDLTKCWFPIYKTFYYNSISQYFKKIQIGINTKRSKEISLLYSKYLYIYCVKDLINLRKIYKKTELKSIPNFTLKLLDRAFDLLGLYWIKKYEINHIKIDTKIKKAFLSFFKSRHQSFMFIGYSKKKLNNRFPKKGYSEVINTFFKDKSKIDKFLNS
jgi:hypothetical protein